MTESSLKGSGSGEVDQDSKGAVDSGVASLVELVSRGAVSLTLHPGCAWQGPKKYICGPVSRHNKQDPWEYKKPTAGTLSFTVVCRGDVIAGLETYRQLVTAVELIQVWDDVEILSRADPTPERRVRELRREHVDAAAAFDRESEEIRERIDGLLDQVIALGGSVGEIGYPEREHPEHWYHERIEPVKYDGANVNINCDQNHSSLFPALDRANLIDPAVPQWFKDGNF
jgi:hypothetical protein